MSLSQIPPHQPPYRTHYAPMRGEPKFYSLLPEALRSRTWREFRANWGVISYLHSRKPFVILFGFLAFAVSWSVPGASAESGNPIVLEFVFAMMAAFLFALVCYAPYKIIAVLMTGFIAHRKFGIQSYREARFYIRSIRKYLRKNDPKSSRTRQSQSSNLQDYGQDPKLTVRNDTPSKQVLIAEANSGDEPFPTHAERKKQQEPVSDGVMTRAQRRQQEQTKPRFTVPSFDLGMKKKTHTAVNIDTSSMSSSQLLGQVLDLEKKLGL